MKARVISVNIEKGETGLLYATSNDFKSLFVVDRNENDLRRNINIALMEISILQGVRVVAAEIEVGAPTNSWVIVPLDPE